MLLLFYWLIFLFITGTCDTEKANYIKIMEFQGLVHIGDVMTDITAFQISDFLLFCTIYISLDNPGIIITIYE